MDTRTAILNAAVQVLSQHGFRGSTTRRIAEAAEVNEVTIFRYFGSKEALLQEAINTPVEVGLIVPLPSDPVNPWEELVLVHIVRSGRVNVVHVKVFDGLDHVIARGEH